MYTKKIICIKAIGGGRGVKPLIPLATSLTVYIHVVHTLKIRYYIGAISPTSYSILDT